MPAFPSEDGENDIVYTTLVGGNPALPALDGSLISGVLATPDLTKIIMTIDGNIVGTIDGNLVTKI